MSTEPSRNGTATPTVSKQKYLDHLARARDTSRYFTFFTQYCRIMPILDAVFLQHLQNICANPKALHRKIKGETYFVCKTSFMENSDIGWTKDQQRSHLKNLSELGYVKVIKAGTPPVRLVCIDYEAIENALDNLQNSSPNDDIPDPPQNDSQTTHFNFRRENPAINGAETRDQWRENHAIDRGVFTPSIIEKIPIEKIPIEKGVVTQLPLGDSPPTVSEKPVGKKVPFGTDTSAAARFSKRFYKEMDRMGKITRHPKLGKWRDAAAELIMKVGEERFERIMEKQIERTGLMYIPRIYSIISLCERFPEVEDCHERYEQDQTKTKKVYPANAVLNEWVNGCQVMTDGKGKPYYLEPYTQTLPNGNIVTKKKMVLL